ncbi:hypothetical protein Droror1_Dr00025361, partial [Drosera rotundifolia]
MKRKGSSGKLGFMSGSISDPFSASPPRDFSSTRFHHLTAASTFFTGYRRTPASYRPHHTISLISPSPSPSVTLSSCPVASIAAALHSISPSPAIRRGLR